MNGHLTHPVPPRLLQFSPFWPACFLCPKPASHTELCCSPHTEKKRKTDHITPLFQFLHWLPIQQRIQYRINSLCYKFITGTAPSYLCDCLQLYTPSRTLRSASDTLSASRFLAPDSSLLVPAPFLFSDHQHGMTFPFLSDRNPLWTHSNLI